VRMSLPDEYPFQRPHMQVITPIHHPLIAPDGRLALHHFLSGGTPHTTHDTRHTTHDHTHTHTRHTHTQHTTHTHHTHHTHTHTHNTHTHTQHTTHTQRKTNTNEAYLFTEQRPAVIGSHES
jgi:hypothetical protein